MTRPSRTGIIAIIYIALAACSSSPPPLAKHTMHDTNNGLPAWFPGIWTREWIDRGGVRSDMFDVRYLQTPAFFGDMRIPRERPAFPNARSFADLSDANLRALAKQRGFSGVTSYSANLATWHHEIDFQPPDSSLDVGRIERIDDAHMYEHATDGSYVESWRSLDKGDARFLAIRVERAGRLERTLLVAGDYFFYVRNRRTDLPVAESLDSLIDDTHATRAQIVDYLDCEFSSGRIGSGAVHWEIESSTLPWKEGQHLDFVDGVVIDDAGELVLPTATIEQWSVPVNTLNRAARTALFPPRP